VSSKEYIEKTLRETIKDITGITDLAGDACLVGRELNIVPVNFLYIFDKLAKTLQLDVYDILKDNSYQVMTVDKLTDAVYSLQ
jgi:hypothetical protein